MITQEEQRAKPRTSSSVLIVLPFQVNFLFPGYERFGMSYFPGKSIRFLRQL